VSDLSRNCCLFVLYPSQLCTPRQPQRRHNLKADGSATTPSISIDIADYFIPMSDLHLEFEVPSASPNIGKDSRDYFGRWLQLDIIAQYWLGWEQQAGEGCYVHYLTAEALASEDAPDPEEVARRVQVSCVSAPVGGVGVCLSEVSSTAGPLQPRGQLVSTLTPAAGALLV
jgi:hypothetical protein